MGKPNFFIVGAPKCGTTALYEYLYHHPSIFMSSEKEPHYFNDDMKYRFCVTENSYMKLYRQVSHIHCAIGEGSILYLYSLNALYKIYQFNKNAKIIIMVRNPINMVYSLFKQYKYVLLEDQEKFETAWLFQIDRKNGNKLPPSCKEPLLLQYGKICKLGEQIERAYTIFPKKQIKVIIFDDFIQDTRKSYLEVLSFLELEDDGKIKFPKINERKIYKNYFLQFITKRQPDSISRLLNKWQFIRNFKNELASRIDSWNSIKITSPPLSDNFRQELADYFRDDVKKLSQLLDRDLTHWIE